MIHGLRTAAAAIAIAAAAVCSAGAAPAPEATPPRLQQLLSSARSVVTGRVAGVESLDSGRVVIAEVIVVKTLKGPDAGGRVALIELLSLPSTAGTFTPGESVLAFLGPAPSTSYVRKTVPPGTYLQTTGGREGALASTDPAVIEEAAAIVARIAATSSDPEPDAEKRKVAARTLIFDELGARHPAVVEDGIAGLASVKPLEPLSDAEQARLAAAIGRTDLPSRIRERLFAQVATLHLDGTIPALRDVRSDDAEVTAAAWDALRRLGAPPDAKMLAEQLRSTDPAVRTAAARELLQQDLTGELDRAGALAVDDPDAKVRLAIIDTLGESKSPAAIPLLEKAFGDPLWEVRQPAGRAIYLIGGRPAIESFARLTYSASPEMQRYAVTMLRASGVKEDDPLLVKIRTEHPDPGVRDAAAHGLPLREH